MKKFCQTLLMLWVLCIPSAYADQISIGINLGEYPDLVLVPDTPVYYAPQLEANYFFYDGEYWLFQYDNWYSSAWYDGPWTLVDPEDVPEYLLRIPVRYYPQPPVYFFSWWSEEPPHWGEHWGHRWEEHRRGWDKWERSVHPKPAPLPEYQREYLGEKYPRNPELQRELRNNHYRYDPHDPMVRQHRHELMQQTLPAVQEYKRPMGEGYMQQDRRRIIQPQSGNIPREYQPRYDNINPQGSANVAPQQQRRFEQEKKEHREAVQHEQYKQRARDGEARHEGWAAEKEQKREARHDKEYGRER
jgi:hypothetical protein